MFPSTLPGQYWESAFFSGYDGVFSTENCCVWATVRSANKWCIPASLTTKGSPLASSKPRWLRTFRSRRPVAHNAASWTIWSAKRGSGRLGGWPVQPQSKSQVPNRKCSGMRSHKPTKLPKTLSERSCRTPRSTLVASQGSTRVRFLVRGVSTVSSPFGRAR